MKKSLVILGIAVMTLLASCAKPEDPTGSLTIKSYPTEPVPVEGTETPLQIVFSSTAAWTASINDEAKEYASVTPKSGVAGDDCVVKLSVAQNDDDADRTIVVTVTAEGLTPATVTVKQLSKDHLVIVDPEIDPETNSGFVAASSEGGDVVVLLNTNVDYVVTDYNGGSFPWQKAAVSEDKQTITVTLEANNSYIPRQSYIKIEGLDLTYRIYIDQASAYNAVKYSASMYDMEFDTWGTTVLSVAVAGGKHYVCNGQDLYEFNPADGSYTTVDLSSLQGFTQKVITNDDAGHIVLCNRTYYVDDAYTDGNFKVVYMDEGGTPVSLIDTPAWMLGGPNGARIKVTGDVTANAIITSVVEGIADVTMSNTFNYWTVNAGVVSDAANVTLDDQCLFTWGMSYWNTYPNNCPTILAISTNVEDGFATSGAYEQNMAYMVSTGGATSLLFTADPVQSGNYGYQCIDSRTVGGNDYLVNVAGNFFCYDSAWVSLLFDVNEGDLGRSVHDIAKFDCHLTNYFAPEWDYAIAPMSDARIYDAGDGKVGILIADLNSRCIEAYEVDPTLL